MKPLSIGNLTLATPLLLAPMAGYCDVAFRLICRSFGGVGMASTDLLSPEGILRNKPTTLQLTMTAPGDDPLCMQLYGADPDRLCDAARWCQDQGAHAVDLNMGCPVDKVTKTNGGSKLLCTPDATLGLIRRLRETITRVPFTCKMRLGWDESSIVAPYLAQRMQDLGVDAVTIHGRTTEMRFSGKARLDGIAAVVAAAPRIPVIGNGDIQTPDDAIRMLRQTGCAGVMVGRGALSRPWLFRDIAASIGGDPIEPEPTLDEKIALMRRHFELICHHRGERAAAIEFRTRVHWYARTMHPCRVLKDGMRMIHTRGDFDSAIDQFTVWRTGRDQQMRPPERGLHDRPDRPGHGPGQGELAGT